MIDLRDPGTVNALVGQGSFPTSALRIYYFAGTNGIRAFWSTNEADATPTAAPGALGELSVRWIPQISRYLMMAMSAFPEDPVIGAAVWLRTAPNPWGPWSKRRHVFDWVQDGLGLRKGSARLIEDGGAAYAPYLHEASTDAVRLWVRTVDVEAF